MNTSLYRVILYCSLSNKELMETVKQRVAEYIDLPDKSLQKLFSGQPIILHHAVDRRLAQQYKSVINATGAVCEIEPLNHQRDIDDVGFIERRRKERRNEDMQFSIPEVLLERRTEDRRGVC